MGRAIAGVVLLAAVVAAFVWLPVSDLIEALESRMRDTGAAGMAVYVVAYAAGTLLMVPGSLLTLLAGLVYGVAVGVALVVPASLLGATGAALLGRTLLRAPVERAVADRPKMRALDHAIGRDGFKMVMLVRLSPILPFSLLNYALGVTAVPLGTYVLASAIGMFPGTLAYVYLGSLIPNVTRLIEDGAPAEGSALRTALLVVGGAATLGLSVWLARAARRAIDEATEAPPGGTPDAGERP
ncbi:MAG: TVP38/TMEM64 family protein [Deltaproteobacteria bacterium]|nr:TVP38/TMEM64 family protein [Deltaproteobacteria bacterium]MCB9789073.1 TVP38/TMEM64 family protein [Deltaproteobacteria bacterium]